VTDNLPFPKMVHQSSTVWVNPKDFDLHKLELPFMHGRHGRCLDASLSPE